jgi:hypothetical protein
MALVELFKDNFVKQNFNPFLAVCNSQVVYARVLKLILLVNQPCFRQILSLYLHFAQGGRV